ncbi:MAG: biotin transporter BioY [Oscillospiraceae bacterium]|nr:biotin transporter BioY [Oscillospiraceae bacterium]
MKQKGFSTYDLCIIAVFAAIIAVMAQIVIPMPYGVPMTMQTLAIMLAGVMLGAKRGFIAVLLYVLLGAIGAPVFAAMTGGPGTVFGPTGGFILSFPLLALSVGLGADQNNKLWLWSGLVIGVSINYLCGAAYFSIITSNTFQTATKACVLPFIPTDIIKILIAGLLGIKIRRLLKQRVV